LGAGAGLPGSQPRETPNGLDSSAETLHGSLQRLGHDHLITQRLAPCSADGVVTDHGLKDRLAMAMVAFGTHAPR